MGYSFPCIFRLIIQESETIRHQNTDNNLTTKLKHFLIYLLDGLLAAKYELSCPESLTFYGSLKDAYIGGPRPIKFSMAKQPFHIIVRQTKFTRSYFLGNQFIHMFYFFKQVPLIRMVHSVTL